MSAPNVNIHGVASITYEQVQSPGGRAWTEFSFWDAKGELLMEATVFSHTKTPPIPQDIQRETTDA